MISFPPLYTKLARWFKCNQEKGQVYFLSVLLKRGIGTVGRNTPYAYLLS
jgi:hypothetical protein